MLWNGGISFGGVCAFILADLIILPILNIYRKYYGFRMSRYLRVTFYAAMVAAGLIVEVVFGALGLIPDDRNAKVVETSVTWNYTTFLNLAFLALATALVVRFLRTGGPAMLRAMGGSPPQPMEPASPATSDVAYTCPMHPEIREEPRATARSADAVGTRRRGRLTHERPRAPRTQPGTGFVSVDTTLAMRVEEGQRFAGRTTLVAWHSRTKLNLRTRPQGGQRCQPRWIGRQSCSTTTTGSTVR